MPPKRDPNSINVQLLDRDYQVACTREERPALEAAARHLDDTMREIKESGRVLGVERIAIMAALNITNELLSERGVQGGASEAAQGEIDRLTRRIESALDEQQQLKLQS